MYGEENPPEKPNQKNGLLHQGYTNIKYRSYTPYELTTFADPVREPGDRIKIHFEDKVTGETFDFETYILSRKISGIQKMMDTYVAKGATANVTFSNYKTSTTYAPQTMGYYGSSSSVSRSSGGGTNLTGLTPNDLVEYIRNIGFRLLDEPSSVTVRFIAISSNVTATSRLINSSSGWDFPYQGESDIHDGDTTNPIYAYDDATLQIVEYNVSAGDYFNFCRQGDGVEYSTYKDYPVYLYDGSKWVYVGDNDSGGCNEYYNYQWSLIDEIGNGTIAEGSNCTTLTINKNPNNTHGFNKTKIENTNYYQYGNDSGSETNISISNIKYGDTILDYITAAGGIKWRYQYPGFWTAESYPLEGTITITSRPHVEIKWTDPANISEWAPVPCSWEGTIVVRKLNAPPLNRWDGTVIVDSTTRDQYKTTAFIDDTISLNKTYYYGIFPYYTAIQDAQHPIKYYRFTKVVRVVTGVSSSIPEIVSIERIG